MTKEDAIWAAVYAHVLCTWNGNHPYRTPTYSEREERARTDADYAVSVYRQNEKKT